MPVKMTMYLVSDKYSFTEDYYYNGAVAPTDSGAATAAQTLANARVLLLGYGAAIERIRISAIPASQLVIDELFPYQLIPTWPEPEGTRGYFASRPWATIVYRFQNGIGQHRNMFVGCAPSEIIHAQNFSGDSGLSPGAISEFPSRSNQFVQYLTSGAWGWLTRRGSNLVQAAGLVGPSGSPLMIGVNVQQQLFGVQIGSDVYVKGWRRIAPALGGKLSGVYTVGAITPGVPPTNLWTYYLQGTSTVSLSNFHGPGQIGPLSLQFTPFAALGGLDLATSRKRGATAGRPRGRSRTR